MVLETFVFEMMRLPATALPISRASRRQPRANSGHPSPSPTWTRHTRP